MDGGAWRCRYRWGSASPLPERPTPHCPRSLQFRPPQNRATVDSETAPADRLIVIVNSTPKEDDDMWCGTPMISTEPPGHPSRLAKGYCRAKVQQQHSDKFSKLPVRVREGLGGRRAVVVSCCICRSGKKKRLLQRAARCWLEGTHASSQNE